MVVIKRESESTNVGERSHRQQKCWVKYEKDEIGGLKFGNVGSKTKG